MDVIACRASRTAHHRDLLSAPDMNSRLYGEALTVAVAGDESVPVVDRHRFAVTALGCDGNDAAVKRGHDGGSFRSGNVDAVVEVPPA